MRTLLRVLKKTVKAFMEDKVLRLSAALAYYAVFSLGPLLIIAISVAGLVFGDEAVRGQVEKQLRGILGTSSAETLESMIVNARKPADSLAMSAVGVLTLLFGASGVFGQLKDALNTIWGIAIAPGMGVWRFIQDRFLSFAMVLGVGFLLLVSMLISTALAAFGDFAGAILPLPTAAFHAFNFTISFAVITILFAAIFKILPDADVAWRDVWVGAVATSLLFTMGKFVLSIYLGREELASSYGAAGAFVIILLWVYYSSVILLFGAEFTQVWATMHGTSIAPAEGAVKLSDKARATQGIATQDTVNNATNNDLKQ